MGDESITSGIYIPFDSVEISKAERKCLRFYLNGGRAFVLFALITIIPLIFVMLRTSKSTPYGVSFFVLFGSFLIFFVIAVVKAVPLVAMAVSDFLCGLVKKEKRARYFQKTIIMFAALIGLDRFHEKAGRKPNSLKMMPDYLFRTCISEGKKKAILKYLAQKLEFYLKECSLSDAHLLFHLLMSTVKTTGKVFIANYSYRDESAFFLSLGDAYRMKKDTLNRAEKKLCSQDAPCYIEGNHNLIILSKEKKEIESYMLKILNDSELI